MNIKRIMDSLGFSRDSKAGLYVGRHKTHDVAIPFRLNAGFPGGVNRMHPAGIEACLVDSVNPPTFFGQAVVADAAAPNGVRVPAVADGAGVIYGVTVRPFPFQQQATTNFGSIGLGAAAPLATGIVDVLKSGYIMVTLQGAAAAAKGLPVYVTTVAGGAYVVGGFSADHTAGTQVLLAPNNQFYFNGPADASGNVEIAFNV